MKKVYTTPEIKIEKFYVKERLAFIIDDVDDSDDSDNELGGLTDLSTP